MIYYIIMNQANQTERKGKNERGGGALAFLTDVLRGAAIGIAFIIPGFSGGSVAAILGIYEKLVGAIADIFHHFKRSFFTLLPIAVGMLLGVAALILPVQWGLKQFPIPTVTLFVGLAIGGLPSVTEACKGKSSVSHLFAFLIPFAAACALSFLPIAGEVDLFSLNFGGYLLLVLVGAIGSSALVIPGISGSMLLLILGYYNPVVSLFTDHLLLGQNVGVSLGVLACLAVGMAGGFFGISIVMKRLLKRFPRGTHFAILGFILGSVPAIYLSTAKEAEITLSTLPGDPWYWIATALLFVVGAASSFALVYYAKKKAR